MIRIANGQGFWGDWLEAPVRLVEGGPIDYLMLDYLAEVTMSILQKQKQADPTLGYARDFPPLIGRIARRLRDRSVKVLANAGGVNPIACAREVQRLAPDLKVAVVLGDDVYDRIDDMLARGIEMRSMDTGEPLTSIRNRILSANAYIGAFPLIEALETGADVIITGRCTDTALALAPMIHEFGWKETRMGPACRRNYRRTHRRMRSTMHRRQLSGGLDHDPGSGEYRISRSSKPNLTERSSSPNIRIRAGASTLM